MIRPLTYDALKALVIGSGLKWWNGSRSFNLNLIVLRSAPGTLDHFDDVLCAAYLDDTLTPHVAVWPCTADPGKPSVQAPRRADGTAQLALGQHLGAFRLGQHKGAYPCLVSSRPLPVVRYRSAEEYAAGAGTVSTSTGIQVHHAGHRAPERVGPWSEGCVVLQHPEHLGELLGLCEAQIAGGWGETFSLSVLAWAS